MQLVNMDFHFNSHCVTSSSSVISSSKKKSASLKVEDKFPIVFILLGQNPLPFPSLPWKVLVHF